MGREHTGGHEVGDSVAEGWTYSQPLANSHANSHLDLAGNGGNYYAFQWYTASAFARNGHMRFVAECHDRIMGYLIGGDYIDWQFINGSTVEFTVRFNSLGPVQLYRGDLATLVATSVPVLPLNRWLMFQMQYRISDTVGLCEVYVDGVLYVTFSGDTRTTNATINTFGLKLFNNARCDEYARNSITMEFDGGVGTPFTNGETITGGTSGATAVITTGEGAGATGTLVLEQWNGTAFVNNETITGGTSGDTALVNAPTAAYVNGFQPNSGRPPEGFVVALVPTAVGTTTQLTSSTGGANWTTVDEIPPNTSDYNYSGVANDFDTYGHAGSQLPASAVTVTALATYSYNTRDGAVINNANHTIRTGGVNYQSDNFALPVSYAADWESNYWNVNPGTLIPWTVAEANATEFGFRVRA